MRVEARALRDDDELVGALVGDDLADRDRALALARRRAGGLDGGRPSLGIVTDTALRAPAVAPAWACCWKICSSSGESSCALPCRTCRTLISSEAPGWSSCAMYS